MTTSEPFFETVQAWAFKPMKKLGLDPRAEPHLKAYRTALVSARRFVVDDAMVAMVAEAATRIERFALWVELARLPFDTIWTEYDERARRAALRRLSGLPDFGEEAQAEPVGVLLVRDKAHEARWTATPFSLVRARRAEPPSPRPAPYAYVIDPQATPDAPVTGASGARRLRDEYDFLPAHVEAVAFGLQDESAIVTQPPDWARPLMALVCEPLARISLKGRERSEIVSVFEDHAIGSIGSLRFLVALVACLNDAPVAYRAVVPRARSRQVFSANVPYLDHSVVSLSLPRLRRPDWLPRLLDRAAIGRRKRAHEVRGHWRTLVDRKTGASRGRAWIRSHQRGDAKLGFVRHTYETKTREDVLAESGVSDIVREES